MYAQTPHDAANVEHILHVILINQAWARKNSPGKRQFSLMPRDSQVNAISAVMNGVPAFSVVPLTLGARLFGAAADGRRAPREPLAS